MSAFLNRSREYKLHGFRNKWIADIEVLGIGKETGLYQIRGTLEATGAGEPHRRYKPLAKEWCWGSGEGGSWRGL